jgi:hypothetical protein
VDEVTYKTIGMGVLREALNTMKECDHPETIVDFLQRDSVFLSMTKNMSVKKIIICVEDIVENDDKKTISEVSKEAGKLASTIKSFIKNHNADDLKNWGFEASFFDKNEEDDYWDFEYFTIAQYSWNKDAMYGEDRDYESDDDSKKASKFINNIDVVAGKKLVENGWKEKTVKRKRFLRSKVDEQVVKGVYTKIINGITCEVDTYSGDNDSNMIGIKIK